MPHTNKEKQRVYWRAWYNRNKEKQAEYNRAWREANPDRCREYTKKQLCKPGQRRRKKLRERYGLSPAQYYVIFESQGFACAVCKDDSIAENTKRRHVDHCHATGDVRGILCQGCNTALGMAKDDPARLRALADYLEHHQTKKSPET